MPPGALRRKLARFANSRDIWTFGDSREICPESLFLHSPGLEIPKPLGRDNASPCRYSPCRPLGHFDCFCAKWLATVVDRMLVESFMHNPAPLNPTPRASRCMNRSSELERQRIDRMSVEERIRLA